VPNPLFRDQYEILEPLGRGRFGVVHHAYDHNLNREVALKRYFRGIPVIHAYDEARVLWRLSGEHVLPVYEAAVENDVPFIAMQVADRGSTADALEREPYGIRPDIAVRWVRDALIGLESAHDHGLIHRDVKPANIFLHGARALVGDFGVAAVADDHGIVDAHGDPHIRPPEMIDSGTADLRADIYAAGVSLYHLLTGQWPFASNEQGELDDLISRGQAEPLRNLAPHVSDGLARVVARAMKRDADDRYQTARALNQALGQVGLVPRRWQRIAPHDAGHLECWTEASDARSPLTVCVEREGDGTVSIQTRFAQSGRRTSGSGRRPHVLLLRVGVETRALFRQLNRGN
jgi:eukaryotic-like serine/threonine-protein kinase